MNNSESGYCYNDVSYYGELQNIEKTVLHELVDVDT